MSGVVALTAKAGSYEAMLTTATLHNRTTLMEEMRVRGLQRIEVAYEGGGDSGGFYSVESEPKHNLAAIKALNYRVRGERLAGDEAAGSHPKWVYFLVETLGSVLDLAKDVASQALEQAGHNGYENGEGGQGTVIIELSSGKGRIVVDHEDNIVEVETSTTEIEIA